MFADVLVRMGVLCNRLQHLVMVINEVGDAAPSNNGNLPLWAFAVPAEVEILHVEGGEVEGYPFFDAG